MNPVKINNPSWKVHTKKQRQYTKSDKPLPVQQPSQSSNKTEWMFIHQMALAKTNQQLLIDRIDLLQSNSNIDTLSMNELIEKKFNQMSIELETKIIQSTNKLNIDPLPMKDIDELEAKDMQFACKSTNQSPPLNVVQNIELLEKHDVIIDKLQEMQKQIATSMDKQVTRLKTASTKDAQVGSDSVIEIENKRLVESPMKSPINQFTQSKQTDSNTLQMADQSMNEKEALSSIQMGDENNFKTIKASNVQNKYAKETMIQNPNHSVEDSISSPSHGKEEIKSKRAKKKSKSTAISSSSSNSEISFQYKTPLKKGHSKSKESVNDITTTNPLVSDSIPRLDIKDISNNQPPVIDPQNYTFANQTLQHATLIDKLLLFSKNNALEFKEIPKRDEVLEVFEIKVGDLKDSRDDNDLKSRFKKLQALGKSNENYIPNRNEMKDQTALIKEQRTNQFVNKSQVYFENDGKSKMSNPDHSRQYAQSEGHSSVKSGQCSRFNKSVLSGLGMYDNNESSMQHPKHFLFKSETSMLQSLSDIIAPQSLNRKLGPIQQINDPLDSLIHLLNK